MGREVFFVGLGVCAFRWEVRVGRAEGVIRLYCCMRVYGVDEDLKLLSAINRLMRDGEGSVFAARAQSEQRSVEKVADRGLREKAKEMLKGYIQK